MSIIFALTLITIQGASGAYLWWLIRPPASYLERAGMGLALGTGMSTLAGVVLFSWLPLLAGVFLPPLLVGILALWTVLRRRPSHRPEREQGQSPGFSRALAMRGQVAALVISLTLGLVAFAVNVSNYPLSWVGKITSYHSDFLFFEALSTSLATLGPSDSIFMTGADLRYHWMAYAWAGQVAELAGTEPFMVLTRILPLTCLVASVLIVIAWTQRLTRVVWAPSLAAVLLVAGGYVGATYGTILNFDSPSQQLATVWMLGASVALWQITRGDAGVMGLRILASARGWLLLGIIGILSAVTASGKASSGLVLLAGWGFATLIALVRRDRWGASAALGLLAAALGAGWVTVAYVAGSEGSGGISLGSLLDKASSVQGLNPMPTPVGIAIGTVLLMIAVACRWAGLIWLVRGKNSRWTPLATFGLGLALAGLLALALFSAGINDTWFPLAASAPLSVISAVGIARAARAVSPHNSPSVPARPVLLAAAIGLIGAGVVVWVWSFAPGTQLPLRWLGPIIAVVLSTVTGLLLAHRTESRAQRASHALALGLIVIVSTSAFGRVMGIWSDQFGVLAAQGIDMSEFRPHRQLAPSIDQDRVVEWTSDQVDAAQSLKDHAVPGELIATNVTFSPLVAALTGLPTYISGINYQAPYGRPEIGPELLSREATSWSFVQEPSAEAAQELCDAGVRYIWVDTSRPRASTWNGLVQVLYVGDHVTLLALSGEACGTDEAAQRPDEGA